MIFSWYLKQSIIHWNECINQPIMHQLTHQKFGTHQAQLVCWGCNWHCAKYKPLGKKVRPVNQPMPQSIKPPLQRPPLSRDPYKTPLTPNPPKFQPTWKITEESLGVISMDKTDVYYQKKLNHFASDMISLSGYFVKKLGHAGCWVRIFFSFFFLLEKSQKIFSFHITLEIPIFFGMCWYEFIE